MFFNNRTALVMKQAARGPAAIALRQQRILRPTQTGVDRGAGVIQAGLAGPARMMVPSVGARLVGGGIGTVSRDIVSRGTGGVPGGLTGLDGRARMSDAQAGARLIGGGVGSNSMGASRLISAGPQGPSALAGFGAVDTGAVGRGAATFAAQQAGTGAGTILASYIAPAAALGPVGLIVGAIVGLAVSQLLKKNYLNVSQINQNQDVELALFNKYKTIQGKVPGRAIGLPTMIAIWKGSEHVGHFPLAAKQKQCFHEGCLKYGGRGDWIDTTINNADAGYQFPNVYKKWVAGRQAGAVAVQTNMAPRSVTTIAPTANAIRRAIALRGLGSLGVISNTPDAVSFVDNYFIPAAQTGDRTPWEVPTDPVAHQLLYDLADAYLDTMPVTTKPYVAVPNAEYGAPPPVTTPAPSMTAPASSGPSATTSYPGYMIVPGLYDGSGRQLYVLTSQAGTIGVIPTFTPIAGQMVQDGSFNNVAANPSYIPQGSAPIPGTPGNTYPLVPVQQPGGGVTYQPAPAAGTNAPVAAPAGTGTNWGPLIALAAGAAAFIK